MSLNFDTEKAADSVKKALRIAPQQEVGGDGYEPSSFSRWMAVESKTNYLPHQYEKYNGSQKVLMLCTEEKYMTMENGTKFSTGNHPVETMLPMMHLKQAGFDIDIVTPTGRPVQLELWAMPEQDDHVLEFYREGYKKFENPVSLVELMPKLSDSSPYMAVFIPGGHGAMLGLPENENVGQLIRWVKDTDRYLISLCHGPAALLAAPSAEKPHPYKGYSICAFPDGIDGLSPKIGYLPGPLPWKMGERLQKEGLTIVNKRASGNIRKDRKLVTGDSPKAANALGKLAANCLLEEIQLSEVGSL